ncbi:mannosyltransferase [Rhodotorula kratochvilovae]
MLLLGLLLTALASGAALAVLLRQFRSSPSPKSVALVVLGDIGRSPRMLYHAQSFARNGFTTYIVAHRGSKPPKELTDDPNVRFVYLDTPLAWSSALAKPLFLACLPLRILLSASGLLFALLALPVAPAFLFVQNPPAIPTLAIVKLAASLRGSKVLIDWHNTGYSVLALRLGAAHPVVRFAKFLELLFGRVAYAHLCVSDAMKAQLVKDAKLQGRVVTFHDRPPANFRRQTAEEAHSLFTRLPVFSALSFPSIPAPTSGATLFTAPSGTLAHSRPALLVSATSWTLDEDFSLLLRALDLYNAAASALTPGGKGGGGPLPPLVALITGRGAGRAAFERDAAALEARWEWVRVRTAWLEREDYPRLLGSADLGVSLHASTSGIDLPMKVVDMFGCGLPVLALDFPCVGELVQDGINGRAFRSAEDLADKLITLLRLHPAPAPSALDKLRAGITEARYGGEGEGESATWGSWEASWDAKVLPLLALP